MPVKVLELHHVGFGVNHAQADAMLDFYRDVLNLPQDPARWKIPGIYGSWINLPNGTQLHILGSEGPSRYAKGPGKDPVSNHIALAVEDVLAAEQELIARGIEYFTLDNVASPSLKQLFLRDPAGNLVELHQSNARRAGVEKPEQDPARAGNE
ncbi:glyoxalase [Achromobacter xylosoxidans]|uniref:VOC family protein n=1 Tax=Alcaligenes xylosoxydans xylosoxydans TaxID=85698 RepID=UPI0006C05589|nr:VOC family protein [Achromobacter xylosoxidans]MCH1989253.1 VOC family protein [Achromobacter xylosoxidans]MCH4586181.1 VOC family protein [Achromobacter xylosoxidans]MCV6902258.1 VOC family protein [Achromobacter xylosoxidans]MCZ8390909.1 VOC family protein [Achromobacter xylosoxidans]OFL44434.1 glyoxalase [Achromobacter xylosoxidans]